MKRFDWKVFVAVSFILSSTNVMAQPYTSNLTSDVYGIAQGADAGSTNDLSVPTPRDDNGLPGQMLDINDAINLLLNPAVPYAHNSDVDHLQVTDLDDNVWRQTDDDAGFVYLGLTAGNTNTLSVYNIADPGTKTQVLPSYSGFEFLGDGSLADPFIAGASPFVGDTFFGWSLESTGASGDNEWDSKPGNNEDGYDHMLTYHLSELAGQTVYITTCSDVTDSSTCNNVDTYTFHDPYLLAWEDIVYNPINGRLGDEDFDDTIILVDNVRPIPEPMSLLLLGGGLAGFAGVKRRKRA